MSYNLGPRVILRIAGCSLGPRVIPRIPGCNLSPRAALEIPGPTDSLDLAGIRIRRSRRSPRVVSRIAGYNLSPRVALEIPGPTDFLDRVAGTHVRRSRRIASVCNVRRLEGGKPARPGAPSRDPHIRRSC